MRYDPFKVPRTAPGAAPTAVDAHLRLGSHVEVTSLEVEGFDVWEDEGGTVAGARPEVAVRRGKRLFDEIAG